MSDRDHRHRFRGPRGRLHLPHWTKDCWRGRPGGCCWLCKARLLRAVLRTRGGA